ncbi:MAG: hypothetical protein KF799_03080 [Bdellovibrionales bacterium]|nr:hypothetical protein [Bdellovibrionales bacterium]
MEKIYSFFWFRELESEVNRFGLIAQDLPDAIAQELECKKRSALENGAESIERLLPMPLLTQRIL